MSKILKDTDEHKPLTAKETAASKQASGPEKESRGEKIYNASVYTGMNYFANTATSILIADYFRNLSGRKFLDVMVSGMAKVLTTAHIFCAPKAHKYSKAFLETVTLMSGGLALLVPLKILEDNKRPVVHWLNKKMGVEQKAPDGHELTPDEIHLEKEQPKQSWWNIVKRRLLVMVVIIPFFGPIYDKLVGEKRTQDFFAKQVNKGLNSGFVPGGKFLAENARAQRYIGFLAMDAIFNFIGALTLWFTRGAKKEKDPVFHATTRNQKEIVNNQTADDTPASNYMVNQKPYKNSSDIRKSVLTDGMKDFRERVEIKGTEATGAAL